MTTEVRAAHSAPDDSPLVVAARWLARLHEEGVASTPDFEAWRARSPEHELAWRHTVGPWRYLGEQASSPELITLRSQALERARHEGRARWHDRRPWLLRPPALAAAAALIVGVGAALIYLGQLPSTYRTQMGERREVRLADGSSVALDSDSEVSVRYSRHARELVLMRGQAHFDVAHDIERPFSVEAGDRKVIATGTSFDVDLLGAELTVTLIEGHVVVLDRDKDNRAGAGADWPQDGVKLDAGERLVTAAHTRAETSGGTSVERVNLQRATAWQAGQLVFDDEPLGTAVERVNRYSRIKLLVKDPRAAALRFSGVFNEGDTKAFIDTVTRYLSLQARPEPDDSVELTRRE